MLQQLGQTIIYSNLILDHPAPQADACFGCAVAAAGDVNKDGVIALLVGASFQEVGGNAFQGQAYVFSGADGSLLLTLNTPHLEVSAAFGHAVAGIGDVNNDGASDMLVGAPEQDVGDAVDAGQAFIFSGATGSLLHTLTNPGAQGLAFFGFAVAAVGNVNPSMYVGSVPDVLVGAPGQNVGAGFDGIGAGRVVVFSGLDGNPLNEAYVFRRAYGSPRRPDSRSSDATRSRPGRS